MNFRKNAIQKMVLLAGGILALLAPWVPLAHAETEEAKIIGRTPDESNPMYERVEVEGGLFFRVPKDMTFVKKDGVIAPLSTEEYFSNKFEGVVRQIAALNKRIAALERNAGILVSKKNQESL